MKNQQFSEHENDLLARGLARVYRGRLIPVLRGGDPAGDPLFPVAPEDYTALEAADLDAFIAESEQAIAAIREAPASFVTDERSGADLVAELEAGVAALESARTELASRVPALTDDELAAQVAELADRAVEAAVEEPEVAAAEEPDEVEEPEEVEEVEEPAAEAAVTAAAAPARRPVPQPTRAHRPLPARQQPAISLVAAASGLGPEIGEQINPLLVAEMMERKRRDFGLVAKGGTERIGIARATWSDLYPEERKLSKDEDKNEERIRLATSQSTIRENFEARRKGALVASGGLCAPVTPYYGLQVISTASRPVRGALAAFNADRGGIRAARPASLSAITTGVGLISAADDAAGGTFATKSCQVVDCPEFVETDVAAIYHCLQFGNLGARTFPERVAQFNSLVLAAQARLAESALLSGIDTVSTQVDAGALGLGATAALLGQILAAANGMRNRHRMDPEAVLRLLIPDWAIDLLISDVIRGQFQRFDTDEARIQALLRSFDIEPTFYIDGASGKAQVFGDQAAGALLPFPENVVWYLYPEGSFLFLDGGTLELGLVRDSVLNSTNDYQIFGETFENVAYVGVESIAVTSPVCDSGTVSLPDSVTCPIDYTVSS